MSKLIPLTQGKFAIVDDEDYEELSKYKWFAHKEPSAWYAYRNVRLPNNKRTLISMHRQILNPPKGVGVDHINHNGLNNKKENIRECTNAQNQHNRRRVKDKTTSKYKGVYYDERGKRKWVVRFKQDGKEHYVGCYYAETEAAEAYDRAVSKLRGNFACLNFSCQKGV